MKRLISFLLFFLLTGTAQADPASDLLRGLDENLYLESGEGFFRTDLSGLLDLETYYIDQRPPGLLFGDDSFFAPRLSLFLDTRLGKHLYSLVQVRLDRGFDPRAKNQDMRLDEYLLRYTPWERPWVNIQIGKFATVAGNWVRRHLSWDNAFITAPLAYENVTIVSDVDVPQDPVDFLNRRTLDDRKGQWLPVLWGPSYTTGASVFGSLDRMDYALEIKNNSLSSRPAFWRASQVAWQDPTITGRFGFRPGPAWNMGASFSFGTYLNERVEPMLPPGKDLDDYDQITLGYDLEYTWRHIEVWAEAFWSRFEVPNAGNADTFVYYIESRYRILPVLFAALRWNQQFFGQMDDGAGGHQRWDRDTFRIDASLTWRFSRRIQIKSQYSYSHQKGDRQQGENLAAWQATFRF